MLSWQRFINSIELLIELVLHSEILKVFVILSNFINEIRIGQRMDNTLGSIHKLYVTFCEYWHINACCCNRPPTQNFQIFFTIF